MQTDASELTFDDAIDLLLTMLPCDTRHVLARAERHELGRFQADFADRIKQIVPLDDDDLMDLCDAEDSYTAEERLIHAAWRRARDKRVH
jgi:hypothetical protein